MAVQSLGYLGISTQDVDQWSDFATRQLGLQLVDRAASCRAFRMDDRRQRLIVDKERPDAERFFGWEVADVGMEDAWAGATPRQSYRDLCRRSRDLVPERQSR